jgi:lambda repressor-like predicted transcriptional regulator
MDTVHIHINTRVSKPDKNFERLILNCGWEGYSAQKAYQYARAVLKAPWPQGERVILKCPQSSYLYARHVIKGRWPKAEKIIARSSHTAYLYAKYVIKGRFPEAEKNRSQGSFSRGYYRENTIYLYSKYIIKGRWREMEDKMTNKKEGEFSDTESLVKYAVNVLKGRWKRIEPEVCKSRYIAQYAKVLTPTELEEFHNRVMLEAMIEPKHSWQINYAQDYLKKIGRATK